MGTFGGSPDTSASGSYFGSLPAQPTSAPSAQPPFGAPPSVGPGTYPPHSPFSAPPRAAASPRSTGRVVLVVGVVLVGLLLVGGAMVSHWRDAQAQATAARTTMALPASIGTRHMLSDAASTATMQQLIASQRLPAQAAIYQATGAADRMVVLMLPDPMSPTQQDQFIAGMKSSATTPLHDVDPGPLGGHAMCGGQTSANGVLVTVCSYVDPAGAIQVILAGSGSTAEQEALAAREQVEVRS